MYLLGGPTLAGGVADILLNPADGGHWVSGLPNGFKASAYLSQDRETRTLEIKPLAIKGKSVKALGLALVGNVRLKKFGVGFCPVVVAKKLFSYLENCRAMPNNNANNCPLFCPTMLFSLVFLHVTTPAKNEKLSPQVSGDAETLAQKADTSDVKACEDLWSKHPYEGEGGGGGLSRGAWILIIGGGAALLFLLLCLFCCCRKK